MDPSTSKPPKSAREYYVNLFCSKNKSNFSKGSRGVHKALKSWWSLSTAEQQPFIDKFNLIQEKYKENYINYLKSVKPFMKKKIVGEGNLDHSVPVPEISQDENNLPPEEDNSQDINESISNEESDQNNQDHAASVIVDPDANDAASPHEIINATEETSRLSEPTPPCTKNAKELFEMVTNAMGCNNLEWKDLSQVEKYKYRSAIFAIKREYIMKYQNYLESLPPIDLFQHYIKTLEKYKLFYFLHPCLPSKGQKHFTFYDFHYKTIEWTLTKFGTQRAKAKLALIVSVRYLQQLVKSEVLQEYKNLTKIKYTI